MAVTRASTYPCSPVCGTVRKTAIPDAGCSLGVSKVTGMPTTSDEWPSVDTRWKTAARREPTADRIADVSSVNLSSGVEVPRSSR